MAWTHAALLSELAEGEGTAVEVGGTALALVRLGDEVYAILDRCSHRDFPLAHGEVDAEACTITCEWHGAEFDLRTGVPQCPPATRPVPVFATRVEGDAVFVELGE